jgi:hypothetical protein
MAALERRRCPRCDKERPIRTMTATAPSGAAAWLTKFYEIDGELGFGCGNITDAEYTVYRKARGLAAKAGGVNWDKARAVLVREGWEVS